MSTDVRGRRSTRGKAQRRAKESASLAVAVSPSGAFPAAFAAMPVVFAAAEGQAVRAKRSTSKAL